DRTASKIRSHPVGVQREPSGRGIEFGRVDGKKERVLAERHDVVEGGCSDRGVVVDRPAGQYVWHPQEGVDAEPALAAKRCVDTFQLWERHRDGERLARTRMR